MRILNTRTMTTPIRVSPVANISQWVINITNHVSNHHLNICADRLVCLCFTSGSTLQDKDEDPVPAEMGQNHPFFRRSDSMTFLGCIPPNPFDVPLAEAIPLADQPHLLQVSCCSVSSVKLEGLKMHSPQTTCTHLSAWNIMPDCQRVCLYCPRSSCKREGYL